MFNKTLYVDVETQDYNAAPGQQEVTETHEQTYYSFSFQVALINGYAPMTRDLWNDSGNYQVGNDRWYFYTAAQYLQISHYYPDTFTQRADFPDAQLIVLPPDLQYASKTEKYILNPDNTPLPATLNGVQYDVPIREYGYFYPLQVLNNPLYSQLFTPYAPLQTIPPFAEGKVYRQQIKYHYEIPTYEYKDLYGYLFALIDEINSFAVFRDFQTMEEDQYGNRASLIRNLPSYFNERVESDISFEQFVFSFTNYKNTITISVPLEEGVSTWNVFSPARKNSWSNTWSISPNVKIQNNRRDEESSEALYFEYEGLKNTRPFIAEKKTEQYLISPGGQSTQPVYGNRTYTAYKYLSGPTIDKKAYFYSRGGKAPESSSNDTMWAGIRGNWNDLNIFNSVRESSVSIGWGAYKKVYTAVPAAHNEWSDNFVLQEFSSGSAHFIDKGGKGGSYVSFGLVYNGAVTARQKYRWEDSPYNIIVPIERMLQFPLYVYFNQPEKEKSIFGYVYEIDHFNVPFRAMDASDKRLSDAGVTSTPMPSIDTTPSKIESAVILNVKYSTFDNTFVSLAFNITKKTRICHARYTGNVGEPGAINVLNNNSVTEIQGVADWDKLESKTYSPFSFDRQRVFVEKEIWRR
jgi:hypothetical protein